jgi:hypothetical protein
VKIFGAHTDSGSGFYRMTQPLTDLGRGTGHTVVLKSAKKYISPADYAGRLQQPHQQVTSR